MNKEEFVSIIKRYLPEQAAEPVANWVFSKPVKIIIKNNRKTKLGDFRSKRYNETKHTVTINSGLNPYEFLITLIHEFAHLEVYEEYGRNVQPHGMEWKNAYRGLMIEYFELDFFPRSLAIVLLKHMRNPKASSHSDLNLVRELALYDEKTGKGSLYLEDLQKGEVFFHGGKVFSKGEKRRTRYVCTDTYTFRKFTISALAKVIRHQEE